jgi:predicted dienelactone hydrolase
MKFFLLFFSALIFLSPTPSYSANDGGASDRPFLKQAQTQTNPLHQRQQNLGKKIRQPKVEIWLPPQFRASEQKWPLIVFSHGFGGCNTQSEFLTSYLADHGYIVIAPNHTDANCRRGAFQTTRTQQPGGRVERPEKPFRSPEMWTEETEADRREDVLFAVSSMMDDRQYKNYVDTDRMGLLGHSLGGYTVLGLAGGWDAWRDDRFKAVAALSPFLAPYVMSRGIEHIDIPVMYHGGTRDFVMTPPIKRPGGAYTQSHAPKYYLELNNANHFAWTGMEKEYQDIINSSVLAFFDRYLKNETVEILPGGKDQQVSLYWMEE